LKEHEAAAVGGERGVQPGRREHRRGAGVCGKRHEQRLAGDVAEPVQTAGGEPAAPRAAAPQPEAAERKRREGDEHEAGRSRVLGRVGVRRAERRREQQHAAGREQRAGRVAAARPHPAERRREQDEQPDAAAGDRLHE
jgi:hypothetical protein